MQSHEDSDNDDMGPALPAGVLRSRGGWADSDNLEIQHQRERMRAAEQDPSGKTGGAHAAVDLSQFRNEEVGKGYKAKHVVRQREATNAATGNSVVDMSGGKFSFAETKKRDRSHPDEGGAKKQHTTDPLESYLKCKGMRDFMKETEKILSQSKR